MISQQKAINILETYNIKISALPAISGKIFWIFFTFLILFVLVSSICFLCSQNTIYAFVSFLEKIIEEFFALIPWVHLNIRLELSEQLNPRDTL